MQLKTAGRMKASLIALICLTGSCALPYEGMFAAVEATRYDERIFQINGGGNAYTSQSRLAEYVMLRAAEETLGAGYQHFVIMDAATSERVSYYKAPTTANTSFTAHQNLNSVSGMATTNVYGGQTFTFVKPRATTQVYMLTDEERGALETGEHAGVFIGKLFSAEFLYRSLGAKYLPREKQLDPSQFN